MADRYWVGAAGQSWDATVGTKWATTSGGVGGASVPTAADNVFFDANSGTSTVGVIGTRPCLSFNATGFTGTLAGGGTPILQVNASLTFGSGMTVASSLDSVSFVGNTASRTITTNGKLLQRLTIATTSTNTLTLQSALTAEVSVTLTTGVLALSSYTLTTAAFTNTSTSARTIAFDTGKIVLTGSGVVFNGSGTGLTVTGTTRIVEPTLSAAQQISPGTPTEANTFDISVPATAGNFNLILTASSNFRSLTFNNATYSVANTTLNIYGDVTVGGTSPTFTGGTLLWTFAATGSTVQTFTSNGATFDFSMVKGGATTSTFRLGDNFQLIGTRTFTLTSGILDLQSYTFTIPQFSSSNSNVRTLAFGTGKISIRTTTSNVTGVNITVTNLTATGSKAVEINPPSVGQANTYLFGAWTEAQALDVTVVAAGGRIDITGNVNNMTFNNFAYQVDAMTLTMYGNLLVAGTTPTFTAGGAYTFAATSGTKTITTNGKTLAYSFTFDGNGGTFQLNDAITSAADRTLTLTRGTLNLQSYTFTIGLFASSNSNTRTLNFGTGKIVLTATGSGTVLNMATSTNFVATGTKLIEFPLNGAGTKTFAGGTGSTEANKLNVSVIAGTSGTSFSFTNHFNDITFDNVSCTISPVSAATIYGNLTIGGTNVSWTSAAVTWTFGSTSGTKTIQTNGVTVGSNFTFNGSGGSWQLQNALTLASARSLILTTGALDLNDYTLTTGIFELSNNTNVRSIDFGTGKITVTTTAGTATYGLIIQNRTNFSVAGNYEFLVTGSMIVFITGTEAQSPHLTVSGSTIYIENSFVNNFSALGFNDIRTNSSTSNALTIYGDFSVQQSVFQARNYPPPVALVMTFAATSGTKTITSNGAQVNANIRFDGVGGTWQFADNFTQQLQTTSGENECILTLTRGTIDINGKSVTTNAFLSQNSNTRGLNFGTGGDLKILGFDSVWFYAWNVSGSGLSISETNSFISFDSGSDKTMNVGGGSAVYPTIRNNTGSPLRIYTSNYGNVTFRNLAVGSVTTRFEFQSSYTFYFTNFGIIPPVGVNAQIYSISSGSQSTLSQSSGIIDCQRLQIKDSNATGGASWYAGTTSVDQGNNNGWIFQNAPQASGNMLMLFA